MFRTAQSELGPPSAAFKGRRQEVRHASRRGFDRVGDASGLWALRVENDNIEPLLAFNQGQAERDETIFGEIFEKHTPLVVASGLSKKNIFDLYDLVRSRDRMISTCVGTKEERLSAMQLVESYQGTPSLLDTYTA